MMDNVRLESFVSPYAFFRAFGWYGEGVSHMEDTKTGDLILVNNFYHFNPVPQSYEDMRWLEREAFPGVVEWKMLTFPTVYEEERPRIHKREFHRGCCFVIRVRNAQHATPTTAANAGLRKRARKRNAVCTPVEEEANKRARLRKGMKHLYH
jgi:hypothetical protein